MTKHAKTKKQKNIRFDDIWNHEEKRLADGVVESVGVIVGDHSDHGKSYYEVRCGFCSGHFDAYKWSLRGGGKRCPHCTALLGSTFNMYQWQILVKKSEDKPND